MPGAHPKDATKQSQLILLLSMSGLKSEKEVWNAGVLSKMLSLQGHGKMPELPWDRPSGAAERENMHFLLSARQRQLSKLPGYGRF